MLLPFGICGINPGFPGLSPARGYVTYVLLTRSPLTPKGSLDLHVLSPPLAFALSQDQTLQFGSCASYACLISILVVLTVEPYSEE